MKPSFDFSENVFTYVSANNGYEIFKVNTSMEEVINYIDFETNYASDVYDQTNDILFYVKDNHLSHIEIPSTTYVDGNFYPITIKVSYSDLNSTIIEETVWDNFVTELTGATSWTEIELSLSFPDETTMDFTFDMILELTLGNSEAIPFFLPNNLIFDVSGEVLDTEDKVQILFETETNSLEDNLADINMALTEAGFEYSNPDEESELYTKENISIYVTGFDEMLIIEFNLPIGELI